MIETTDVSTQDDLALQVSASKLLLGMPVHLAIGVACSYLLHSALNHRQIFRRVINEKVHREGFGGVSLLTVFNRVGK